MVRASFSSSIALNAKSLSLAASYFVPSIFLTLLSASGQTETVSVRFRPNICTCANADADDEAAAFAVLCVSGRRAVLSSSD